MNENPVMFTWQDKPMIGYVSNEDDNCRIRTDFYEEEGTPIHPEAESAGLQKIRQISLDWENSRMQNLTQKIYDNLIKKIEDFVEKLEPGPILEVEISGTGRYVGYGTIERSDTKEEDEFPYKAVILMTPDDQPLTFQLGIFDTISEYDIAEKRNV